MTIEDLLARLERPRLDVYLDAGAARLKEAAADHWPSPSHEENLYATGRSAGAFEASGGGDQERVVECAVDYSGYTDGGFTRSGRGTARPFERRGGKPYLEQVADAQVEAEAQALVDHIVGSNDG